MEYKNPYNARGMTISEVAEKINNSCLSHNESGYLSLKKSHDYYYQIQLGYNVLDQ